MYALLLSIIVGILLEILQIIPFFRRFFDFQDMIANIIGAIGGIFLNKLFSIQTTNKLF
ncbi:MAG: VanZ family protein [Flavobacteriaceae bacterium]